MVKEIIVLLARIFLFLAGIAAVCAGQREANQTLTYAGVTFMAVAFLLSCISRKKRPIRRLARCPGRTETDDRNRRIKTAPPAALCERRLRYAHFFLVSTTLPAMMSRSRSLPSKIIAS